MIKALGLLLSILLPACASSPAVQYYVLEPIPGSINANLEIKTRHSIGIGPLSLPALLENKKMITRLSDNTVQIAQFQQWAAPLQDNIVSVLARNLSLLQPDALVRTYPWSVHGTVDRQIIIEIVRFDATPGKAADLEVNWTIKNEINNVILKNGRSVINLPLNETSYPGTVHALSKLLGNFSQELSLALLKTQ